MFWKLAKQVDVSSMFFCRQRCCQLVVCKSISIPSQTSTNIFFGDNSRPLISTPGWREVRGGLECLCSYPTIRGASLKWCLSSTIRRFDVIVDNTSISLKVAQMREIIREEKVLTLFLLNLTLAQNGCLTTTTTTSSYVSSKGDKTRHFIKWCFSSIKQKVIWKSGKQ